LIKARLHTTTREVREIAEPTDHIQIGADLNYPIRARGSAARDQYRRAILVSLIEIILYIRIKLKVTVVALVASGDKIAPWQTLSARETQTSSPRGSWIFRAHKAAVITTQLPVEHWHAWIADATIADAILDRRPAARAPLRAHR
jgi:hypothetical protein